MRKLLMTSLMILPLWASGITQQTLAQLKTLDNQSFQSEPGKDTKLLYFWATWCPECKQKMKGIFKEVALNPNFDFLLVNTEKDPGLVKNFLEKEGVALPVLMDAEKTVRKELKVFSVPQWVLLRKSAEGYQILGSEAGWDYDKIKTLVGHK